MNIRAQKAATEGRYIRALVLAGFDVSLNGDRMLAVHSKNGFEGAWETAREAWNMIKAEWRIDSLIEEGARMVEDLAAYKLENAQAQRELLANRKIIERMKRQVAQFKKVS